MRKLYTAALFTAVLIAGTIQAQDESTPYTKAPPVLPQPDTVYLPAQHMVIDTANNQITCTIRAKKAGTDIPLYDSTDTVNVDASKYLEAITVTFSVAEMVAVLNVTSNTGLNRVDGTIKGGAFLKAFQQAVIDTAVTKLP